MSLAVRLGALRARVEVGLARVILGAPAPLLRLGAGALPRREDGTELDPIIAFALRLRRWARRAELETLAPDAARRELAALNAATDLAPVELARVEDVCFPGAAGPLAARIYRPTLAVGAPALLFFHGGGFVLGDLDTHDPPLRRLAKESGVVVVAALYRLAPEHKFPAACEDVWAALRWIHGEAARLGLDPARLAVGGDSAGGNLAAGLAHRARREGGPPIAAQLLVYPGIDFRRSLPSHRTLGQGFGLTSAMIDWFLAQYLTRPEEVDDPRTSPLVEASFDGLPPAVVAVAGFDPLRDEGLAYAARLRAAEVPVELVFGERLTHGFLSMAGVVPAARATLDELAHRLGRALGALKPPAA